MVIDSEVIFNLSKSGQKWPALFWKCSTFWPCPSTQKVKFLSVKIWNKRGQFLKNQNPIPTQYILCSITTFHNIKCRPYTFCFKSCPYALISRIFCLSKIDLFFWQIIMNLIFTNFSRYPVCWFEQLLQKHVKFVNYQEF